MKEKPESLLYKMYQKFSSMKYDVYSTMIYLPTAFKTINKSGGDITGIILTPIEFRDKLLENLNNYITTHFCDNKDIMSIKLESIKDNYIKIEVSQKYSKEAFMEMLNYNLLNSEYTTKGDAINDSDLNKQFCSEYLKSLYPDNKELNEILDKL